MVGLKVCPPSSAAGRGVRPGASTGPGRQPVVRLPEFRDCKSRYRPRTTGSGKEFQRRPLRRWPDQASLKDGFCPGRCGIPGRSDDKPGRPCYKPRTWRNFETWSHSCPVAVASAFLVPPEQVGLNQWVKTPVQNAVHVTDLILGAMIFNQAVGLEDVGANLAAPGDFLLVSV